MKKGGGGGRKLTPGGLGGSADDLSAQGLEDVNLLLAHLLREGDDAPVALDGGGEGQTNTGVAGGGLDDGVSGL